MHIKQPSSFEEFEQYYRLRYEVLRKPWHQPPGSERSPDDDIATHLIAVEESTGEVLGGCRVHLVSPTQMQLRYMCVAPQYRNKQIGRQLLVAAEEIARHAGVKEMFLQAREHSVNFYLRNGYVLEEKTHLLFGEIQHYQMRKFL